MNKKNKKTIKINGNDVKIGDAIEMWLDRGDCRACIDYRLEMNDKYQDSYENFAFLHCNDCLCD